MVRKLIRPSLILLAICFVSGCVTTSTLHFPASDELFVTTGDGDIQKPYEPIGQVLYSETGFRLSMVPILGLIRFHDVDPDVAFQKAITEKVRKMGADSVINLGISWEPPKNGFLGIGANGGSITIYGTAVKR